MEGIIVHELDGIVDRRGVFQTDDDQRRAQAVRVGAGSDHLALILQRAQEFTVLGAQGDDFFGFVGVGVMNCEVFHKVHLSGHGVTRSQIQLVRVQAGRVGCVKGHSDNQLTGEKPSNFNLPNVLTSLRILFVPVFAWLVLTQQWWWAFGLFALLMATDKLDGDIARARNLVTDFGKIADPIADKALMITALVTLNIASTLPVWMTVMIVVRELGITVWRMVLLRQGKVVPASQGGKIKTTLQALGVALYLCPLPDWMDIPSYLVMLAAVIVTVVTGIQYLVDGRKANRG